MAVVIRLQGLPDIAGSADIRRFFSGLNIPDGGVHIIGGEKGEAFIIFATDEDARQAMRYSRGYIKGSRIAFFLSSKTEMQNVIDMSRKRSHGSGRETSGSRWAGSRSNYEFEDQFEDRFRSNGSRNNTDLSESHYNDARIEVHTSDSEYLYICGMPYSATEDDVLTFFAGLKVESVIMFKINGLQNGKAVVKFATLDDAMKGLQRDREYIGNRYILVRRSSEETWIRNGGKIRRERDHSFREEQLGHDLKKQSFSSGKDHIRKNPDYAPSRRRTYSRSPPRKVMAHAHSRSPPRKVMAHAHSRSPPRKVMAHVHLRSPPRKVMTHAHSRSPPRKFTAYAHSRSPPTRVMRHTHSRSPPRRVMVRTRSRSPPRRVMKRSRSRSVGRRNMSHICSKSPPRKSTARSRSPFSGSTRSLSPKKEYYVHLKNLPLDLEKRDLRAFFGESGVPSSQITFLKTHENKTNKEAIVMFRSMKEYCSTLGYHREFLHGRQILIYPISKEAVLEIDGLSESKRSPERHHHVKENSDQDGYSGPKICVYARNFPYDVTKVEVQKFFAGFNIFVSDIHLLYDDKGIGLGEALVKFRTEDEAQKAESFNRQRFLGTEVLLRCISEKQMQEFGINISSGSEEKLYDLHSKEGGHIYPVNSEGPSIEENPSDYRHPSNDYVYSPDHLRGSAHPEFGEGTHNFNGGPNRVTLVKLKNIPFRALTNEILDFFYGYRIVPESLSIQQNEHGRFSREGVIGFVNYNEAVAAVNELNDRPIGQHKIRLILI